MSPERGGDRMFFGVWKVVVVSGRCEVTGIRRVLIEAHCDFWAFFLTGRANYETYTGNFTRSEYR